MSIPDYQTLMLPMLKRCGDGKGHALSGIVDALADEFGLTAKERNETFPNGQHRIFSNRVGWSRMYLKKAGLLDAPRRGHLAITDLGRAVLEEPPVVFDVKYLKWLTERISTDRLPGTDNFESQDTTPQSEMPEQTQADSWDVIDVVQAHLQKRRDFVGFRFKSAMLERLGLPDIEYPVPMDVISDPISLNEVPLPEMLYWLMLRASGSIQHWQDDGQGIFRLSEIIAPRDEREEVDARGDDWYLKIGKVDLSQEIVTIQRGCELVAALQDDGNGRLHVSAYRPLDVGAVLYLCTLGVSPSSDSTLDGQSRNWEYAKCASLDARNLQFRIGGVAYLSYWQDGLGISLDGSVQQEWHWQCQIPRLPSNITATQIGVSYSLSDW